MSHYFSFGLLITLLVAIVFCGYKISSVYGSRKRTENESELQNRKFKEMHRNVDFEKAVSFRALDSA
uniref:Uncharacterized protein n=1 Tax=Pyramimonas orientalis virus TaxID=455367 RepID=A0A7M3UNY7_POV01|nr:hypothetical protein HWQ62_00298 [Pyramimonas orientalis virus]